MAASSGTDEGAGVVSGAGGLLLGRRQELAVVVVTTDGGSSTSFLPQLELQARRRDDRRASLL
jgi:hypothetical protein